MFLPIGCRNKKKKQNPTFIFLPIVGRKKKMKKQIPMFIFLCERKIGSSHDLQQNLQTSLLFNL
jgi:hypothetical protein